MSELTRRDNSITTPWVIYLCEPSFKQGGCKIVKNYFSLTLIMFICLFLSIQIEAATVSAADLWDISQGTVVTASSDFHPSAGRFGENMFGGGAATDDRYNEGDNTLFVDGKAPGYEHWIEWETSAVIQVNSFNLVASHDLAEPLYRAFGTFTLFNWVEGAGWNLLYTYTASNPYGGGTTYSAENYLELEGIFSPVAAQKFRAVFTQYSSYGGNTASGPRIHELDGYYIETNPVPIPSTISLLVVGVLAISGVLRKKK